MSFYFAFKRLYLLFFVETLFILSHHTYDFFPLETVLLWLRNIFSPRIMGTARILWSARNHGHSTFHSVSRLLGNSAASCVLGVGYLVRVDGWMGGGSTQSSVARKSTGRWRA